MKTRFPIGAESVNRGLAVAAIERCDNVIPVPRGLDKAQGTELKTRIDKLNGVLVA